LLTLLAEFGPAMSSTNASLIVLMCW